MRRLAEVEGSFISVGFRRLAGDGRHASVCFRHPVAGEGVIELAFHHDLRESRLHERYWCALLDIDPLRVPAIVGTLRTVVERSGEVVPYGLGFPVDGFDAETGAWLLTPTGQGLTCATFVVAALRLVGVDLIKPAEWPPRDDDGVFRNWVVETLREEGHTEQAAWIEANDRGARIRPEEVAAAALAPAAEWPVGFATAEAGGKRVLEQVAPLELSRSPVPN